jgi:hypothetical protein
MEALACLFHAYFEHQELYVAYRRRAITNPISPNINGHMQQEQTQQCLRRRNATLAFYGAGLSGLLLPALREQ